VFSTGYNDSERWVVTGETKEDAMLNIISEKAEDANFDGVLVKDTKEIGGDTVYVVELIRR
jgi:hypothetical protein